MTLKHLLWAGALATALVSGHAASDLDWQLLEPPPATKLWLSTNDLFVAQSIAYYFPMQFYFSDSKLVRMDIRTNSVSVTNRTTIDTISNRVLRVVTPKLTNEMVLEVLGTNRVELLTVNRLVAPGGNTITGQRFVWYENGMVVTNISSDLAGLTKSPTVGGVRYENIKVTTNLFNGAPTHWVDPVLDPIDKRIAALEEQVHQLRLDLKRESEARAAHEAQP